MVDDTFFEDDGESNAYLEGGYGQWHVKLNAQSELLRLSIDISGTRRDAHHEVTLLLPRQEIRSVELAAGNLIDDSMGSEWRTLRITI